VSALGVGAVFTPESQRGHGHAPAIVKALEDQARTDGAEVSLLFSEIGPHYYARLGYTQIPLQTVEVEVDEKDGAPAMLVRAGEDADAAGVAAMHDQRARRFDLALLMDDAQVRYSVSKKRIFVGLARVPSARSIEYIVSEEGQPGGRLPDGAGDARRDGGSPTRAGSRRAAIAIPPERASARCFRFCSPARPSRDAPHSSVPVARLAPPQPQLRNRPAPALR
jgi:hypothetical protein